MYVLESYHAAASFQLMWSFNAAAHDTNGAAGNESTVTNQPLPSSSSSSGGDMDILQGFSFNRRFQIRSQIIRLILSTNLTDHASFLKAFNNCLIDMQHPQPMIQHPTDIMV